MKLSDNFNNTYGITIGTNHLQCAEPPDPIVKCANFNRRPIIIFVSVYQMQLCTVSSAFIIGGIPFAFIKGSRYSDPIDYLICINVKYILVAKILIKQMSRNLSDQFFWIILS